MDIALRDDDQAFVDELVAAGRYGSAEDAVHDGLRILRGRESKLAGLRDMVERSIADERRYTDDEVGERLEALARELGEAQSPA